MGAVDLVSLIPLVAFLALVILQSLRPRRKLSRSGWPRVQHNLLLFVSNTVVMRLLVPISLLGVASWCVSHQIGLFSILSAPLWLAVIASIVILDFAIYWQHVATHKVPFLWRMHKVHHADTDMDVTTAIRFHPLELFLSLLYKSIVVAFLGAPLIAVIIFEALLFVSPAFNHSNLKLPQWLDSSLRFFVVTPDTHRSHHSQIVKEQNTNFGFFLIFWDKLFHSYTVAPQGSHETMAIGLVGESDQCDRVDQMLLAPFK